MKKEINLLKKGYLETVPPEFLEERGIEDLWNRVNKNPRLRHFYFSRIIVAAILVFIVILVSAKPGAVLSSVKILSEKAVKQVKENLNLFIPLQVESPTPIPEVSPTLTPDNTQGHEDSKRPENGKKTKEIKGISLNSEEDKNGSPQDHSEGKPLKDSSAKLEHKNQMKENNNSNNNSDKPQSDEKKVENPEKRPEERGKSELNNSSKDRVKD